MDHLLRYAALLTPLLAMTQAIGIFRSQFPKGPILPIDNGVDPGKPLFLTPYIEKGDISTGRRLSLVGPLDGTDVKSYSGFFTVDKMLESNMFFWFFPAQVNPNTAPVLLWLQGGPGGSSLFGLFVESGPFGVTANIKLFPRKTTWTKQYSVLYIDNPVGTGFSFTKDDRGFARNETDVAVNLYNALSQFFTLFPEISTNPFYLTGESYAGKYIPALAYHILNSGNPMKIKLTGVAIGDGFTDPINMFPPYSAFMYNIGMLDENQRDYFQSQINIVLDLCQHKHWAKAYKILGEVQGSYFANVTGSHDMYNYLRTESPKEFDYYGKFLALPEVRHAIHVGSLPYGRDENKVEEFLMEDILQSEAYHLAAVMENYKVLIYTGQLDVIVALPLTEAMLQKLQWKGSDAYKAAPRKIWRVNPTDTEVAGYVRQVNNFYQVLVRGGGHILPYDQPERTLDMLNRFINNKPFS